MTTAETFAPAQQSRDANSGETLAGRSDRYRNELERQWAIVQQIREAGELLIRSGATTWDKSEGLCDFQACLMLGLERTANEALAWIRQNSGTLGKTAPGLDELAEDSQE